MKKLSVAIVAMSLALALVLTACGGNQIKINPDKQEYVVGICQLVQHEALDSATKGFKDGLTEALRQKGRTVVFDEQNASGETNVCTTIVTEFVAKDVDLIMANATPALQAAAEATLTIPVVATSITEYGVALDIKNFNGVVGGNITGTSDLAPLDEQAQMITTLFPSAKKVGVLYCSAESNSQYQFNVMKSELEKKNVTVSKFTFTDSNDIASVLNGAVSQVDVIYLPTDNTVASNVSIINDICSRANVPVICGEEGPCKVCGVATLSISYYNLGVKTGQMAAKILLGEEDISQMQIGYDEQPVYKYNEDFCTKYGVTPPSNYTKIAK